MTQTATTATIIRCDAKTDLAALGVKPGWFVRFACCTIWFEVLYVADRWVQCVARDPKKGTDMAFVGDHYSAINDLCDSSPGPYASWIDKERRKSFFDKFYPERENIVRPAAAESQAC